MKKRKTEWDGKYIRPSAGEIYFAHFYYLGIPDKDFERIRPSITVITNPEYDWLLRYACREYSADRSLRDAVDYFKRGHLFDPVIISFGDPVCALPSDPCFYFFRVIAPNGTICWIHRSMESRLIEKTL